MGDVKPQHLCTPKITSFRHRTSTYRTIKVTNLVALFRFLQMLLACEENLLINITIDRPTCRVSRFDVLPRDIEHALLDVIEKEVDLQRAAY